jgi:hypothetical protein
MKNDYPARALFETLRFAVRIADMSDGMARAILDRAIHELPERWVVTHATHDAIKALIASDFDRSSVRRAHIFKRNDFQRELVQLLKYENPTLEEWSERLAQFDRTVLSTQAENAAYDAIPQEFLAACVPVPTGLFAAKGHSSYAIGYAEQQWLQAQIEDPVQILGGHEQAPTTFKIKAGNRLLEARRGDTSAISRGVALSWDDDEVRAKRLRRWAIAVDQKLFRSADRACAAMQYKNEKGRVIGWRGELVAAAKRGAYLKDELGRKWQAIEITGRDFDEVERAFYTQ